MALRWHTRSVFAAHALMLRGLDLRGHPRTAFRDAGGLGLVWLLCWHPRYAFVLHASPLCGAAPTFLCRRKEK
jgi:hypothetical protein